MNHERHSGADASHWVQRWSHLVASGATVLDVACGGGRHVRWFASRGCRVTGVDRDGGALQPLRELAEVVQADIENGPWPFDGRRFDAVVVINYLWRPLLPAVVACVAEGGVLIWETFAAGNESVGKPSNPQFLLRPGELLTAAQGLRVVAFEDGFENPPERFVQRIVAVREAGTPAAATRYLLAGAAPSPGQVKSAHSEDLP